LGLSVIQEIKLFSPMKTRLQLNFYEFVADQYATLQWNHNKWESFFARIPFMQLNWRIISVKGVYGSISDENRSH
jgi:hypothetical protein